VIALIQRVGSASVSIDGGIVASIGHGLLVFVGVRPVDDDSAAIRLLTKVLEYRIFSDEAGKMNLDLRKIAGDLLLVPQFTLAADTSHGRRPGFSTAAKPEQGRRLYEGMVGAARAAYPRVQTGVFGAHMQVSLVNDGPVTFWLES
jgi:D-tyrosyl-tRNA(Tyr) deacylase